MTSIVIRLIILAILGIIILKRRSVVKKLKQEIEYLENHKAENEKKQKEILSSFWDVTAKHEELSHSKPGQMSSEQEGEIIAETDKILAECDELEIRIAEIMEQHR